MAAATAAGTPGKTQGVEAMPPKRRIGDLIASMEPPGKKRSIQPAENKGVSVSKFNTLTAAGVFGSSSTPFSPYDSMVWKSTAPGMPGELTTSGTFAQGLRVRTFEPLPLTTPKANPDEQHIAKWVIMPPMGNPNSHLQVQVAHRCPVFPLCSNILSTRHGGCGGIHDPWSQPKAATKDAAEWEAHKSVISPQCYLMQTSSYDINCEIQRRIATDMAEGTGQFAWPQAIATGQRAFLQQQMTAAVAKEALAQQGNIAHDDTTGDFDEAETKSDVLQGLETALGLVQTATTAGAWQIILNTAPTSVVDALWSEPPLEANSNNDLEKLLKANIERLRHEEFENRTDLIPKLKIERLLVQTTPDENKFQKFAGDPLNKGIIRILWPNPTHEITSNTELYDALTSTIDRLQRHADREPARENADGGGPEMAEAPPPAPLDAPTVTESEIEAAMASVPIPAIKPKPKVCSVKTCNTPLTAGNSSNRQRRATSSKRKCAGCVEKANAEAHNSACWHGNACDHQDICPYNHEPPKLGSQQLETTLAERQTAAKRVNNLERTPHRNLYSRRQRNMGEWAKQVEQATTPVRADDQTAGHDVAAGVGITAPQREITVANFNDVGLFGGGSGTVEYDYRDSFSNMYQLPGPTIAFEVRDGMYSKSHATHTLEIAFQATKVAQCGGSATAVNAILNSPNGFAARDLMRKTLSMTPEQIKHWSRTKVEIMTNLLSEKFAHGAPLKPFNNPLAWELMRTYPKMLVEKSSNSEWGAGRFGQGKNMQGTILMSVRLQLIRRYNSSVNGVGGTNAGVGRD